MKYILPLICLALLTCVAGCSSAVTNIRQQISPTYHVHTVEADQSTAYEASRAALVKMNFRITGGGMAQGRIEAISAIDTSNPQRPARQYQASVRFSFAKESNTGTAIQILFTEIQEDTLSQRQGMGTMQPLASSPLYDVFFDRVDQLVADAGKTQQQ